MLRAPSAAGSVVARVRRRTSQAHLQRGVRGPALRRAQDEVRRHSLPTVLRQERSWLVKN